MNQFAATLQATLYVFSQNLQARGRNEEGQTTAEYVGILAFVALLAVAVIGFATPIGDQANKIITAAFDKISSALG